MQIGCHSSVLLYCICYINLMSFLFVTLSRVWGLIICSYFWYIKFFQKHWANLFSSLIRNTGNRRQLVVVRRICCCSQFMIFLFELLGPAKQPMACPSSSKRRIMNWETFQISGGKNNCLLLHVASAKLSINHQISMHANLICLLRQNTSKTMKTRSTPFHHSRKLINVPRFIARIAFEWIEKSMSHYNSCFN